MEVAGGGDWMCSREVALLSWDDFSLDLDISGETVGCICPGDVTPWYIAGIIV